MRIVIEEGLEPRWERHRQNQLALIAGVEAMGLKPFVEKPADRLPTVTAVKIPAGVDDLKLRSQLLDEFNIEIAGGIGATKGQIWRLGLMGFCSQKQFVLELLGALDKALVDQSHRHELAPAWAPPYVTTRTPKCRHSRCARRRAYSRPLECSQLFRIGGAESQPAAGLIARAASRYRLR